MREGHGLMRKRADAKAWEVWDNQAVVAQKGYEILEAFVRAGKPMHEYERLFLVVVMCPVGDFVATFCRCCVFGHCYQYTLPLRNLNACP